MIETQTQTHTHATIPCALLDVQAHLPPDEQVTRAHAAGSLDIWDVYRIQTRRAQLHLEMRMELLRREEERQQEMMRR